MMDRTERFELRLSPEEAEELRVSSQMEGISASDYMRQLLRRQKRERSQKSETVHASGRIVDGSIVYDDLASLQQSAKYWRDRYVEEQALIDAAQGAVDSHNTNGAVCTCSHCQAWSAAEDLQEIYATRYTVEAQKLEKKLCEEQGGR